MSTLHPGMFHFLQMGSCGALVNHQKAEIDQSEEQADSLDFIIPYIDIQNEHISFSSSFLCLQNTHTHTQKHSTRITKWFDVARKQISFFLFFFLTHFILIYFQNSSKCFNHDFLHGVNQRESINKNKSSLHLFFFFSPF